MRENLKECGKTLVWYPWAIMTLNPNRDILENVLLAIAIVPTTLAGIMVISMVVIGWKTSIPGCILLICIGLAFYLYAGHELRARTKKYGMLV